MICYPNFPIKNGKILIDKLLPDPVKDKKLTNLTYTIDIDKSFAE